MFAARPQILDDRLLAATGLLILTLLFGAAILALVDRWRRRHMAKTDNLETLTSYRQLYDEGEITQEEYNQIRSHVASRIRSGVKPKQSTQPADPSPAAPPPDLPLSPDD